MVVQDNLDQMGGQDNGDEGQDVAENIFDTVHEVQAAIVDQDLGNVPNALVRWIANFGVLGDEVGN